MRAHTNISRDSTVNGHGSITCGLAHRLRKLYLSKKYLQNNSTCGGQIVTIILLLLQIDTQQTIGKTGNALANMKDTKIDVSKVENLQ